MTTTQKEQANTTTIVNRLFSLFLLATISCGPTAAAWEKTAEVSVFPIQTSTFLAVADDSTPNDSTEESIAARCALLAARGDVEELRPLYSDHVETLPEETALYCRLAFARAENDNLTTSVIIDSLENQYADRLGLRGLLALADVRSEALCLCGDYAKLKNYCRNRLDWCYRRGIKQSRQKSLRFYQQLATQLIAQPAPHVEWTTDETTLPISRDWPIMIPAALNDNDAMPFLLEEEQQFTLISEKDAEDCNITPLGDPISLNLERGTVSARPAIADFLHIGNMTISHALVFIAGPDVPPPYNRSLGYDVLHRVPQMEITDQTATFRRQGTFLRKDTSSRQSPDYVPLTLDDYLHADDMFSLLRNEPSLFFTLTEEDRTKLDEVLEKSLTPPSKDALPRWLQKICIEQNANQCTPLSDYPKDNSNFSKDAANSSNDSLKQVKGNTNQSESSIKQAANPIVADASKSVADASKSDFEKNLKNAAPTQKASVTKQKETQRSVARTPYILLNTKRGLAYERLAGQRYKTVILNSENTKGCIIDLQNMIIYVP